MDSYHWSRRDGQLSLVKKRWTVIIGQEEIDSYHWSRRDRQLSLVNNRKISHYLKRDDDFLLVKER